MEDGTDWWYCEDHLLTSAQSGAQPGVRFDNPDNLTRGDIFENVRLGGYVPEEHVKDMDLDGVDVGIIYPTVGLNLYSQITDSELLTSLFRTYNDWLAEFCKPFPDRLKGVAMINIDDVQEGIREMEHYAKLGLAAAMISMYPWESRGYDLPEYEPLWAAAQDLEMPLGLHVTTNRPNPGSDMLNVKDISLSFMTNRDYFVRMSISRMIFSGVFERYPKLQVGVVEFEVAWVLHMLSQMDYNYTQRADRGNWHRFKEDMLPSDYFHRNVFLSFQEDSVGIRLRDIIGVDNLLWGSDYPHQESTFPRSRDVLEEILVDCTEEEKAKISGGNAARVYRLN